MNKTIFTIATAALLTSCSVTHKKETPTSTPTNTQQKGSADQKVAGTYIANLPGANTDIQTELILNVDQTFLINSVHVDKNKQAFTEKGTYKIENHQLELVGSTGARYFEIEETHLKQLDRTGKEIATTFPEKYKYMKQMAVPFVQAKKYFVKNNAAQLGHPKIATAEKFSEIFGMGTTMGKDGKPTAIDFSKQYVIAVILPETDFSTSISPVSLLKDEKGSLTLTYKKELGQKQTFTTRPTFQIIINQSESGKIEIKEQK